MWVFFCLLTQALCHVLSNCLCDDEEWKDLPLQDVLTDRTSSVSGIHKVRKKKDIFGQNHKSLSGKASNNELYSCDLGCSALFWWKKNFSPILETGGKRVHSGVKLIQILQMLLLISIKHSSYTFPYSC